MFFPPEGLTKFWLLFLNPHPTHLFSQLFCLQCKGVFVFQENFSAPGSQGLPDNESPVREGSCRWHNNHSDAWGAVRYSFKSVNPPVHWWWAGKTVNQLQKHIWKEIFTAQLGEQAGRAL